MSDHRATILVADDSEDIRNLFGVMLKKHYDVKYATNSEETLAAADTDPLPDLVLLDVEMPSMNGYEVCKKLKANPALAHIPIIFVTGRTDPKDQAQGLMAGAVDYIVKPISAPITMLRAPMDRLRCALELPALSRARTQWPRPIELLQASCPRTSRASARRWPTSSLPVPTSCTSTSWTITTCRT